VRPEPEICANPATIFRPPAHSGHTVEAPLRFLLRKSATRVGSQTSEDVVGWPQICRSGLSLGNGLFIGSFVFLCAL